MNDKKWMFLVMFGLAAGCGSAGVDETADPVSSTSPSYVDGKADNLYDCPQCSLGSTCNGDVEVTYGVDCTGAVCSVHAEERRDCALEGLSCIAGTCVDTNAAPVQPAGSVKRIFVTNLKFTGNLARAAGLSDGLLAADALCQLEAEGANIGGRWKAWLSTTQEDAAERIADVGPWYLVDEQTFVANSLPQLITQGPAATIDMKATGTTVPSYDHAPAWTGSSTTGRYAGYQGACDDWTVGSRDAGATGSPGSTSPARWGAGDWDGCDERRRLYCFEQ